MLRVANTNMFVLPLIYDILDFIIENVKRKIIIEHRGIYVIFGHSISFNVVLQILESRSNTPLYCLAYFLVPKYYYEDWHLDGISGISRIVSHEDK